MFECEPEWTKIYDFFMFTEFLCIVNRAQHDGHHVDLGSVLHRYIAIICERVASRWKMCVVCCTNTLPHSFTHIDVSPCVGFFFLLLIVFIFLQLRHTCGPR